MEKKLFLLTGFLCLYLTSLCFTPPYLLQPQNQVENISQTQTFSWVTNNELQSHELKIHECDYEQSSSSSSINLGEFEFLRYQNISNVRQVSGLTVAEGYRYPLMMCADEFQQLDVFDRNSLRSSQFNWLFGFNDFTKNYGGITHLYNHHHILADEATGKLIYLTFAPRSYSSITYPLLEKYDLNININNSAEGIEGIAYNQFTNSVYVAKEKSPMALYEFKAAAAPDFENTSGSLTQPFNLENAAKTWNVKNVSGLFHLSKSSELNGTVASNNLLVLSSESKVLIECDLNGKEISRLNLNTNGANGTLASAIEKATGIAYSKGIIYILSSAIPERNISSNIFAFSNSNYKAPNATIGSQVYIKSNIQGSSHTVNNVNYDTNKSYCWNIVGKNSTGLKFESKYFSFGENTIEPPKPEIVKQITLKKPLENAAYRPGQSINIEWEQNIDFKVNVYFYNGSSIVRSPAINYEGRNVQFVIPSNSSTGNNYSIRVTAVGEETIYDDNKIRVDGNQITIIKPTPNFTYEPNNVMNIEWVQNVDFRVNIDFYNGASRIQNITSNFSGRKVSFKIPGNSLNGSNYSIRVSSTSNTANFASRTFSIKPGPEPEGAKITISSPSAGQTYLPGATLPVKWDFNRTDNVTIALKNFDDNTIYKLENNYSNTGFYNLKSSIYLNSGSFYVEVTSTKDGNVLARTGRFTIAPKPGLSNVKLSNGYLNNNTKYMPGDVLALTWDDSISGDVVIQLFNESALVSSISGDNKSDGFELITLKSNLPISDNIYYRIKVVSKDDNSIYGWSAPFRITTHTIFQFTKPYNTSYNSRGIIEVAWRNFLSNAGALSRVKLSLMKGNEIVKIITNNTANDGSVYWIPGSNIEDGNDYRLRLESKASAALVGISPYFSLVKGQLKLNQQVDFSIAPNPATDFVNISFENTLDNTVGLKLFNANGACLKDIIVDEQNLRLDVSDLSPGYYFINLRDDKNNINKKLLIE